MPSQSTKSTSPHQSWRGVRTPLRQFVSCVLVDVDDTLDSIFSSDMFGRYVTYKGIIGINAGLRIRGINAKIRGGEVQHTGVVPFLKSLNQLYDAYTKWHPRWIRQSTSPSSTKRSKTSSF